MQSRRAVWEISSVYPRVFGAAYRFPLDTVAVNRGLEDGRGRTLIVRAVDEPSGQMPVAVLSWHLSQRLDDPLLVIAASPRLSVADSPTQELIIETGFRLLVDTLLYVASDHRAWALARLPSGSRERKRAEEQLGGLLFDVEGQGGLARYLRELYDKRLSVSAREGRRAEATAPAGVIPARARMSCAASAPIASRIASISAASRSSGGPGACTACSANQAPISCSVVAIRGSATPERSAIAIASSATFATSAPYSTASSSRATGAILRARPPSRCLGICFASIARERADSERPSICAAWLRDGHARTRSLEGAEPPTVVANAEPAEAAIAQV